MIYPLFFDELALKGSTDKNYHNAFLYDFLRELRELSLHNTNEGEVSKRSCTVELRVMICDAPMRAYLKGVTGHSGFWSCERCTVR